MCIRFFVYILHILRKENLVPEYRRFLCLRFFISFPPPFRSNIYSFRLEFDGGGTIVQTRGDTIEVCVLARLKLLGKGCLNSENFYMYSPVHPFMSWRAHARPRFGAPPYHVRFLLPVLLHSPNAALCYQDYYTINIDFGELCRV